MKTHQQVIAAALDEAWQHGTTGADAQDIINALRDAGYTILPTRLLMAWQIT